MTIETLNALRPEEAEARFRDCCAATPWVQGMLDARPYASPKALLARSHELWRELAEQDWLDAFEAHPKIGDVNSLRAKYASTKSMASGEQAGASTASEDALQRLKAGNDAYLAKFGFIFIICASGKSASEMLELLEARLFNSHSEELENAAKEQAKISELRLEKLL